MSDIVVQGPPLEKHVCCNLQLVGALFMLLRHAATNAHLIHLSTPSYASHVALQEWYDGIIPLADELAETALGAMLSTERLPLPAAVAAFHVEQNPVTVLSNVIAWLETNRAEVSRLSEIQNILDEIAGLTHRSIYKLTSLT